MEGFLTYNHHRPRRGRVARKAGRGVGVQAGRGRSVRFLRRPRRTGMGRAAPGPASPPWGQLQSGDIPRLARPLPRALALRSRPGPDGGSTASPTPAQARVYDPGRHRTTSANFLDRRAGLSARLRPSRQLAQGSLGKFSTERAQTDSSRSKRLR
jgi:hypothetical protein